MNPVQTNDSETKETLDLQADEQVSPREMSPRPYIPERRNGRESFKDNSQIVLIGAGIGAAIGAIAGGGSGAAKGAAIGGGAGTGVVLATRGKEVELAEGTNIAATTASAVTVEAR